MGRDMALRLAEKGNDIIITYNTNEEEANTLVTTLNETGVKAAAIQLNIGHTAIFDSFFARLQEVLNKTFNTEHIDFLINNAGFGITVPSFATTTTEQVDALIDVHLKGNFFFTQKALAVLNDGGAIVNISTGLTRMTYPGSGAYAMVKSAIETLTRYLAKELGIRGIRANVVAPGAIATDFNGARLRSTPQMQEHIKSVTALNRIGQADDIGGVVAFLCSDDARWVTGQRIEASGGMYL